MTDGRMHRPRHHLVLAGIACLVLWSPCVSAAGSTYTVYVSPNGDDRADGSVPEQGDLPGTGPVRTVDRAKALVRLSRAAEPTADRAYAVVLRGGRYELERTLAFGPEDSGDPGNPVVYRSYPGEVAHLTGGAIVVDWQIEADGIWSARYHDAASPDGCPSQLFVDGERRGRPRLPERGTYRIERVAGRSADGRQPNDRFYARSSDLPETLVAGGSTEVVVFDAWTASRMRLTAYDAASGLLSLSGRFAGHGIHQDMTPRLPYYIENVRGRPLAEATWQCDVQAGVIRYRPGPNEAFPSADVLAPRLATLVRLQGRDGKAVHDIRFEDLYFEATSWHLPPQGWAAMQAEVGLPAAIEIRDARGISLSGFALVHTGANGINIAESSSGISVTGGELRDLGGSGIAIGSSQRRPLPGAPWSEGDISTARTHDIVVHDNLIASVGRIHSAAVGVWIGQADHVVIKRNEIRDLYYSGISMGWTWDYGPTLSHDNKVIGNVVRRYGQGLLSDFGGIYTLGSQTDSLVADNILFDGVAREYGGHGLYADAASGGILFRNNLVSAVSHAGIQVNHGTDLLFNGNALLGYREAGIKCVNRSRDAPVRFEGNLLQSPDAPPVVGVCGDPSYVFAANLLLNDSQPLRGLEKTVSESEVSIHELGSAASTDAWRRVIGASVAVGDTRALIDAALRHAGRISPVRLTSAMRDGPRALP